MVVFFKSCIWVTAVHDSDDASVLGWHFIPLRIRKIKDYDPDFTSKDFAVRAQEIFIEAHHALTK